MARKTLVCDTKLYNWDYSSLYTVIRCQLKAIRNCLEDSRFHLLDKKLRRRIMTCEAICLRQENGITVRRLDFYDKYRIEVLYDYKEIPKSFYRLIFYYFDLEEKILEREKQYLLNFLNKYLDKLWC